MKLTERIAYLQGLIDGLELDDSTKEGKVLLKMSEVLTDVALYIDDLQSQIDELTELCDILDEDLGAVEEDLYDFDEDDYDCGDCDICDEPFDEDEDEFGEDDDDEYDFDDDDDELYEVVCPTCGDTVLVNESMLEEGSINCPNCHELLEFDFDDLTIEDIEDMNADSDADTQE